MIWWGIVTSYLLIIYATIGIASGLWDRFNDMVGGRGTDMIYPVFVIAGFALFAYMLFFKKEKQAINYFLLVLFVWGYLMLEQYAIYPVEKVHLVQYALLGIFVYNALKVDLSPFSITFYIFGLGFCMIAGIIDEVIQWFLPDRVFDLRDIGLNWASSILAMLAIKCAILKPAPVVTEGD